ncbi:DUF5723 family protein [Flavobacterium sediminilitoris]|uniref:DUF5723 family protein n=1 Tax=Flavobacterium sediminilitoris TaxID=2024526 RepID=A0ABY4HJX8_9FLAO|nr:MULTISPECIES: DUF5723 family protein [Flavobacterium]UOX32626.1 DUF5723 family protein [Flavobacterium sediminilitoris]
MKKCLFVFIVSITSFYGYSQSFFGTQYDNYSGINSVISNPSNIINSRFKTDINLSSASLFAGNDYYSVKLGDLLSNDYDFEKQSTKHPKANNNFYTNIDALGPSFMVNINDKSAVAFFSRVRAITHVSKISGLFLNQIQDEVNEDFYFENQNFSGASNAWIEYGLSYARVLIDNDTHSLKGGISIKYLNGISSGYIKARNLSVNYDYTGLDVTDRTTTTGNIETGNISSLNDFDDPFDNRGSGFGVDLGVTYELKSKDFDDYLLKFGLSVTDLGKLKYKNATKVYYDANASYTDAEFALNDDFDSYYTRISESKSFNVSLPSTLHLNADWHLSKKFFLNLNSDLNLISVDNTNSNFVNNTFSLTPRFETKWLSIYAPLSSVQNSGFQAGFGFRAGPLLIGSGSVVSALFDETDAIDVHVGLKIPIYKGSKNN